MPFLTVDGIVLHYREQPGPAHPRQLPALLLHCAGASSLMWLPLLRRLGRAGRLVALDLPGHGRSIDGPPQAAPPGPAKSRASIEGPPQAAPPGPPLSDVTSMARLVLRFVRTLGLEEVALVGHSLGGAVALAAACAAAAEALRVSRLGLVATAARLPVDPGIRLVAASGTHHLERLFAEVGFSPRTPPRVAARAAVDLVSASPQAADADFRACDGFDLRGRLAELRMPALVVIGDDDRLVPPARGLELAGELPAARTHRLAATGHMIPLERPAELATLLADFLDAGGARTGAAARTTGAPCP